MRSIARYLGLLSFFVLTTTIHALSYPITTPTGETTGGTYRLYFDNIFSSETLCDGAHMVVGGFNNIGQPICVTPVSTGLYITGQTIGDTLRYNGTDWVRNNLIYNDGSAVGIANQTPGYLFDVGGTANFLGIRMPTGASSGYVLTTDAAGLAHWSDSPNISLSGVTGGSQYVVPKFGLGGTGLILSSIYDDGVTVGINTLVPSASYKLDVVGGDARLNGIRFGVGGGNLTSNVAIGLNAFGANVTSPNNVVIGNLAGTTLTAGAGGNILIGNSVNTTTALSSNELNIGNWIYGNNGNIGIGTGAGITTRLKVDGQIQITGGSPAAGSYLQSDASGIAVWTGVTASAVTATGITGGTEYYLPKFGVGGNGLYASVLYESGGRIGLNTMNPSVEFDVNGTIRVRSGSSLGYVFTSDANGVGSWQAPGVTMNTWNIVGNAGTTAGTNFLGTTDAQDLVFKSNSVEYMRILTTGKVGIGTSAPGQKLTLSGGSFQLIDGTQGAGKMLISDANGVSSWTGVITATSLNLAGAVTGSTLFYRSGSWNVGTGIYNAGGNIGIGTATPGSALEVAGQVKITGGTPGLNKVLTSDASGLATWTNAISSLSGSFWTLSGNSIGANDFVGTNNSQDLVFKTNGIEKMRIRSLASTGGIIASFTGGDILVNNMTVGPGSGGYIESNTVLGYSALSSYSPMGSPLYNTAIGSYALSANTNNGQENTAIGGNSLINNTGGSENTAVGVGSLYNNLVGNFNTAVGYLASYKNTGSNNTSLGYFALSKNIAGSNNVAIGYQAGGSFSTNSGTISRNTLIGANVGQTMQNGSNDNTIIGYNSAASLSTGLQNTILGSSISLSQTASRNIGIGYSVAFLNSSGSDQLNIGNWIYGSGGDIGIGTSSPGTKLEVAGQVKITGGSPAAGRMLISDTTGLASWTGVIIATNLNLAGAVTGSTLFYRSGSWNVGTGIYNAGGNIGIGTATPGSALEVAGQVKITGGTPGVGKFLVSDASGLASWQSTTASLSGTYWSLSGNTVGANDYIGTNNAQDVRFYSNATQKMVLDTNGNLGIGIASAGTNKLYVNGDTYISGALSILGKLYVDTIVSRTVTNVTVSGSLLPDSTTPIIYRDLGSNTQRWNNAYLTGQITLGGGSPGLGKFLVSDATGLASWTGVITATNLNLAGAVTGSTLFFRSGAWNVGTGIFNDGGNIGIGTATPGTKLEVAGQVKITGGSPGINEVLTSDATGLATWTPAISSLSGSFWTLSGNVVGANDYIGTNNAVNLKFYTNGIQNMVLDTSGNVGIGTSTGTAKLEVAGQVKILGGTPGAGKFLVSDTTGLASWTGVITATNLNLAGAITGSTLYYNSGSWLVGTGLFNNGTRIGIGTATPGSALEVNGQVKITGGIPGAGKVLTSDAVGLAFWTGAITATSLSIPGSVLGSTLYYNGTSWLAGTGIYNTGGNIGIGSATPTSKLTIDSGVNNTAGMRLTRISPTTPVFTGTAAPLGVDGSGNVVVAQQGAIPVYTALGGSPTAAPDSTTNPPTIGADYDSYFDIAARQSFTVTDVGGNPYNCPEFKTGSINKGPTGCTATPWASYVMTAQNATTGNRYAYQILISDRTDAPFVVRGGMFSSAAGTLMNTAMTIPALWFKAITVPTNRTDWLYINPGVDQNNNVIAGGGNVGLGTTSPQSRLEVWNLNSGGTGSKVLMHFQGTNNIGIGSGTVRIGQTGNANSGFGHESLFTLTSGYSNTAIGYKSMRLATTGFNNSALGQESLYNNAGGSWNTTMGFQSAYSNTSGTGNIAMGALSLYYNAIGANNIALGYYALRGISGNSTSNNIAIGLNSLSGATGNNNVAVGADAGTNQQAGSNNVTIGYNAEVGSPSGSDQLSIGNWLYGSGGNIGIGVAAPTTKLDVNGSFKLGTAGTITTAAGTCTIASTAISTAATAYTCTGVPASTAVAVTCSAAAAFTTPGTTALYCRANGGANSITCNTTVVNAVATTYKCMWMQ